MCKHLMAFLVVCVTLALVVVSTSDLTNALLAYQQTNSLQECEDSDGDGYLDETCGGDDCNDADPQVYPGASEACGPEGTGNGIDDNCDGWVDEGCQYEILFQEDWELGIDPTAKWHLWGDPRPQTESPGYQSDKALDTQGDLVCESGLYTLQRFDPVSGWGRFTVKFWAKTQSGYEQGMKLYVSIAKVDRKE